MKNAALFLSSFFLLLSCSVKESLGMDVLPGNTSWKKNIPLAGNAWVLTDPLASSSLIQENGLANWPDPAHSIGIFFHLSRAGEIRIAIRARVISGESVLKYTFGGKTGEISLHNTNWAIIPIGTFVVGLPGYQKLELQGKNHTGPTFAEVEEVLLGGAAAKGEVNYVKDEFYWGRRGPSVHLWYPQADGVEQVEWFYNEITVPEGQDVLGSYFMANGFNEGYFGFQVNSDTERRVLIPFSKISFPKPGPPPGMPVTATNGFAIPVDNGMN